jgi:hypothetical protein
MPQSRAMEPGGTTPEPRGTASFWDKIDYSLVVSPAPAEPTQQDLDAAQKQKKAWRRSRPFLDALGTLFWAYVILQVFFIDVDKDLLGSYADYRFFLFAFLLAVLFLVVRKTWAVVFIVLYILFFPLVVVLWKVPKLLYMTHSPIAFMAAANVLASVFSDLKRSVIVGALIAFAGLAIAVSDTRWVLGVASVALAVLLVRALYRTFKDTAVPNRFLQMQQGIIRRALDAKFVRGLLEPAQDLRRADIEKFNQGQQTTVIQSLGNAVISHRLLNFWAYQLDRYRRSAASVLLNAGAYLWLLVRSVVALAFLNLALYHADPHAFSYSEAPDFLTFVRYVIAGLYGGEIKALSPASALASALSVATFVVGVLVVGSAVVTSFLSYKASRDDTEIRLIIKQIKDESDRLDARVRENYDVSVPEAIQRLEDLKYGLMGVITALSTRIPRDFEDERGAGAQS